MFITSDAEMVTSGLDVVVSVRTSTRLEMEGGRSKIVDCASPLIL